METSWTSQSHPLDLLDNHDILDIANYVYLVNKQYLHVLNILKANSSVPYYDITATVLLNRQHHHVGHGPVHGLVQMVQNFSSPKLAQRKFPTKNFPQKISTDIFHPNSDEDICTVQLVQFAFSGLSLIFGESFVFIFINLKNGLVNSHIVLNIWCCTVFVVNHLRHWISCQIACIMHSIAWFRSPPNPTNKVNHTVQMILIDPCDKNYIHTA